MDLRKHPMLVTLRKLKGNPAACLYTEPLWGIPYYLYMPFASLYMVALGLDDIALGVITTISAAAQVIASVFSGVVTDKLGRRKATIIFDLIGWSVPMLIWAFAQNFMWFAAAAVFNSLFRITQGSWSCLMVEDTDEGLLVHLFAITHIAGLVSGFFAPITFFLVRRYELIPTMRFLYGLSFVMMTAKFLILYFWSTETRMGKRRMEETRGQSTLSLLKGCGQVLRAMAANRLTVLTIALFTLLQIASNAASTFWPLLVKSRLGVPEESLSLLSTVRTLVMLACYLTVVPRLTARRFERPMLTGFALLAASQLLLIILPAGAYPALVLTVVMEALAWSIVNPLRDSLQMLNIDPHERARVLGLFQAVMLLAAAPFGYLTGLLSAWNRIFPFLLSVGLYALAALCARRIAVLRRPLDA